MKSPNQTNTSVLLTDLRRGEGGTVSALVEAPGIAAEERAILLARLRDLGFVPGARCEVIASMWPGGDPLAVRIGGSTFALRRVEAAAVRLARRDEHPAIKALTA
jgi:ferrous iron transport protein A